MNSMSFIVWMFPIIFMFHDFEEILMAEVWGNRYREAINATWPKSQPFGLKTAHNYHTPSFSIAVEVLFLLFSLISFFSVFFQNYYVWFAVFAGVTIHFVITHMWMCVRFKHYVPGVITSTIFLGPSVWLLFTAEKILHYDLIAVMLVCLIGIAILAILKPVLHNLMSPMSRALSKYSEHRKKNNE
jgi:hypothetical protein